MSNTPIELLKRYVAIRNKARNDLFYLAGILNYTLAYKDHENFHQHALENITQNQFSFTEIARGFFKTTLYTVTLTIQDIINDPNIRIFIVSFTATNARAMLSETANHFLSNENLRFLFPHICPVNVLRPETGVWNQDGIVVNRSIQWKECTIEAGGVDQNTVSKHFDRIRADDIVVWQNTRTLDQIEKTINYIGTLPPLMNMHLNTSRLSFLGTSWEPDDPYQKMKSGALIAASGKSYACFKMPAELTVNIQDKEVRIATFPKFFPMDKLLGLQKADERAYDALYKLDPNDTVDAIWNKSMIQRYQQLPPTISLSIYGGIDPAISERDVKRNSDAAVVVIGIDQLNEVWWLDYKVSRGAGSIVKDCFELFERWQTRQINKQVFTFRMFSCETIAFQKLILRDIQLKMQETGVWIPFRPDNPYTDKTARVMIFDGLMHAHKVHIRADMTQLESQMLRFGKPNTKIDILDAGAQAYKSSMVRIGAKNDKKKKNIFDPRNRFIRGAVTSVN